jgi:quinoprotein glucose dehydrogenase
MRYSILLPLALLAGASAAAQSSPAGEWPAYGRDRGGERYSPLDRIHRGNVARLAPAWEYSTGEAAVKMSQSVSFEATPLMVGGFLYLSTPLGKVIALEPETGRERWVTDLQVKPISFGDFTNRGVSVWADPQATAGAPLRSPGDRRDGGCPAHRPGRERWAALRRIR